MPSFTLVLSVQLVFAAHTKDAAQVRQNTGTSLNDLKTNVTFSLFIKLLYQIHDAKLRLNLPSMFFPNVFCDFAEKSIFLLHPCSFPVQQFNDFLANAKTTARTCRKSVFINDIAANDRPISTFEVFKQFFRQSYCLCIVFRQEHAQCHDTCHKRPT